MNENKITTIIFEYLKNKGRPLRVLSCYVGNNSKLSELRMIIHLRKSKISVSSPTHVWRVVRRIPGRFLVFHKKQQFEPNDVIRKLDNFDKVE